MKPNFKLIPTNPGVYRFYDHNRTILYIGKAKNLRSRVSSYWAKDSQLTPAKQQMVSEIADVDFIVVDTEKEALLLEAGLIKKNLPPYNIELRDDKNWTYIAITNETYPRIITTHGRRSMKAEYFGPFTSAAAARGIVRLIHRLLPIRTHQKEISSLPGTLNYLQFILGRHNATEYALTPEEYTGIIDYARRILRGEKTDIIPKLRAEMTKASRRQEFEKAAILRDKIQSWEHIYEPQHVLHEHLHNQDIIAFVRMEQRVYLTILQIRRGQIAEKLNFVLENKLDKTNDEVLEEFLTQLYAPPAPKPREIIVSEPMSRAFQQALYPTIITTPQRGAKKKLLGIAEKNAWLHYQRAVQSPNLPQELYQLKEILALPNLPLRIEAYDISNISGEYAVGAMVVAVNGKMKPSEYRKFKIKTVQGPNDVKMMREMILRRQNHDEWGAPDLIMLDGGKPQLNTVYPVLRNDWKDRIVALAKQEEEIFVPGRSHSIKLPKDHPALLLLRNIRDNVHRTAITYYRTTHKKNWKK